MAIVGVIPRSFSLLTIGQEDKDAIGRQQFSEHFRGGFPEHSDLEYCIVGWQGLGRNTSTALQPQKKWYCCFYLHRLRDSVSPVCGIFLSPRCHSSKLLSITLLSNWMVINLWFGERRLVWLLWADFLKFSPGMAFETVTQYGCKFFSFFIFQYSLEVFNSFNLNNNYSKAG